MQLSKSINYHWHFMYKQLKKKRDYSIPCHLLATTNSWTIYLIYRLIKYTNNLQNILTVEAFCRASSILSFSSFKFSCVNSCCFRTRLALALALSANLTASCVSSRACWTKEKYWIVKQTRMLQIIYLYIKTEAFYYF